MSGELGEIIDLFSDALSNFILLSIRLQETNANPNGTTLDQHGNAVCKAAAGLSACARDIAVREYEDFPELQAEIVQCVDVVDKAAGELPVSLLVLYNSWKRLVAAVKIIGEATSRLLIVVYGVGIRRLEEAGRAALESLEKLKPFPKMPVDDLVVNVQKLVDQYNDASTKTMKFAHFVNGESASAPDEAMKQRYRHGFEKLSPRHQSMSQATHAFLGDATTESRRTDFYKGVVDVQDAIHEILGSIRPPEDLDAMRIIESLFAATNRSIMQSADQWNLAGRGAGLGEKVSLQQLLEAAEAAKAAVRIVQLHQKYKTEEVMDNTNFGSSKIAYFQDVMSAYAHQPGTARDKFEYNHGKLTVENGNMVNETNLYLDALGGKGAKITIPKVAITGNQPADKLAIACRDFLGAVGTPAFVASAQNVGQALRDFGDFEGSKAEVMALIQAGKAATQSPGDEAARGETRRQYEVILRILDPHLTKAASRAEGSSTGAQAPSKTLWDTCDRIIRIIDDVIGDARPNFDSLLNRGAVAPIPGASLADLARAGEAVINQLNAYDSTIGETAPADTVKNLGKALDKGDTFAGMLKGRRDEGDLGRAMQRGAEQVEAGERSLVGGTKAYLDDSNRTNEGMLHHNVDDMKRDVQKILDEIRPAHLAKPSVPQVGSVTADELARQAERVKAREDIGRVTPRRLGEEVSDAAEKVAGFEGMVNALASKARTPALASALRNAGDDLDRANGDLVAATNRYFDDPDSQSARGDVKAATEAVDRIVDRVMAEVRPVAQVGRGQAAGAVTPGDIERAAQALKRDVDRAGGFEEMSPKEHVVAANNASERAADLSEKAKAFAGQSRAPELAQELRRLQGDLDQANRDLVDSTNAYIANDSPGNARAVQNTHAELRRIADEIVALVKPRVRRAERLGPLDRKVSPKEIEEAAELVRRGTHNVDGAMDKAPKRLAGEAEDTSEKMEKLKQLVDTMKGNTESPAMLQRLHKASDELDRLNDRLVDEANAFIAEPSRPGPLRQTGEDIRAALDRIVKDVRPLAEFAGDGQPTAAAATAANIRETGEALKKAVRKVQDEHKRVDGDVLVKDTGEASQLGAKFTGLIGGRAETDSRPDVKRLLEKSVPALNEANKGFVASSNEYVREPNNSNSGGLNEKSDKFVALVDSILNALFPQATVAEFDPNKIPLGTPISAHDLEVSAEEVRRAVQKVQKFQGKMPKAAVDDTQDASLKMAKFCRQLEVKAAEKGLSATFARQLGDARRELEQANRDLVNFTNAYLNDPDNPRAAENLNAECEIIYDILDRLLGVIKPKAEWREYTGNEARALGLDPSAQNLREAAEAAKRAISKVQQGSQVDAPTELVGKTDDAQEKTKVFTALVGDRAKTVARPLGELLNKTVPVLNQKNRRMVDDVNAHVPRMPNPDTDRPLQADCEDLKAEIDRVLAEMFPEAMAQKGRDFGGKVSVPDFMRAGEEMKRAVQKVEDNYVANTPRQTVAEAQEASEKIDTFRSAVAARASQSQDPELKGKYRDGERKLEQGNRDLIDAVNRYLADPSNRAAEERVRDITAHLKALADDLMGLTRPVPKFYDLGDVRLPGVIDARALREAYEAARAAVRRLDSEHRSAAPLQTKDNTEDASQKVSVFGAMCNQFNVPDAAQKQVQALVQQLRGENKRMVGSAGAFLGNPDDAKTSQKLSRDCGDVVKTLDALMDNVRRKAELAKPSGIEAMNWKNVSLADLEAMGEKVKADCRELKGFPHKDDGEIVDDANLTSKDAAKFAEMVQGKSKGTPNEELRKKLEVGYLELNTANKKIVDETNRHLDNHANGPALDGAAQKMMDIVDRILQACRDAEKPQSFADRLTAAAQAIIDHTNTLSALPEEIRALANRLAELIKQLAEAARLGERQRIIQVTHAIFDCIKELAAFPVPIMNACKDPKLKDDISISLAALKNFATQLKIVASVKAASVGQGGENKTAENQLVACCKGISDSVNSALYSTQSAKLRQ